MNKKLTMPLSLQLSKCILTILVCISLIPSAVFGQLYEADLIIPHPYFMKPTNVVFGDEYAVVYRSLSNNVVYCIYELKTHRLMHSDLLQVADDDDPDAYMARFARGENFQEDRDIYLDYYIQPVTKFDIDQIENQRKIYYDRNNALVLTESDEVYLVHKNSETQKIIPVKNQAVIDDFVSEPYYVDFSISPNGEFLAYEMEGTIHIFSTADFSTVWSSDVIDCMGQNFKLMDNHVIVLPQLYQKTRYQHLYWYDYVAGKEIYSTHTSLSSSMIRESQAYNYLILSFGDPESGGIEYTFLLNLQTGQFSEAQESNWKEHTEFQFFVRDSLVQKEIPDEAFRRYFDNQTYYMNWNDLAKKYYAVNEENGGALEVLLQTPATADPSFFEENGYYDYENSHLSTGEYDFSLYRNYEIVSTFENKVTYQNISKDMPFWGVHYLKKELFFWNGTKDSDERKVKLIITPDGIPIFITPDNYFFSTKNVSDRLAFKKDFVWYSFEQFDLKYNRPDIVLDRLGYADSSLVEAYHQAYLKRLKKMGFTEDMLKDELHLPTLKIENQGQIPAVSKEDTLRLNLLLDDTLYPLDRINVWVNDVAVFGVNGISLRSKMTQNYKIAVDIPLAFGHNKIQISVLNQAGAESYKEMLEQECTSGKKQPDLYLLTIGVSNYKDSRYNLTYASKDASDMMNTFEKDTYFSTVYSKTLSDEEVTLENLTALKLFFAHADINDHVIVFVAGHGVLDNNFDYYYASYDMDFQNPSARGIPYEAIEGLLDGIRPLKKLLFMDTCHSGEVDKDDVQVAENSAESENDIVFRHVGVAVQNKENQLGLQNTSELMKSLFTDLRKGTGATVISSAGGVEFAMESDQWKNGLFTYCLIQGLTSMNADLNKDGKVMVSELQTYVQQQVNQLSNGKQTPTSRIENQALDYRVW